MKTIFEKHIPADDTNSVAVDFLAQHTELSKQKIKDAMQKGCVWQSIGKTTKRLRRAKKVLQQGSEIHIYYNEKILNSPVIEPTLVADEKHYSVWNKPSGMLSQGSKWGDHCTLLRWSEQHLKPQRNSFLIHRLDRAASGLILIAHSKEAAAKLSRLFQDREIRKQYHAQVEGIWSTKEMTKITTPIDGKSAISHVKAVNICEDDQLSTLIVDIETGRKHQIRKHLSESGYPILGDRQYGAINCSIDLRLCSIKLDFLCPLTNHQRSYNISPSW